MTEIKRLGPPQAISSDGPFYRFAVPLNAKPSSARSVSGVTVASR